MMVEARHVPAGVLQGTVLVRMHQPIWLCAHANQQAMLESAGKMTTGLCLCVGANRHNSLTSD